MNLTQAQQAAVVARGNVLVMAGAGTGKTSALVERSLHCLLAERPRVSLDEILMVTFTEAAAADMRRRIRQRLERELAEHQSKPGAQNVAQHLREQLALFETAHIGTLHSFCFKLVRQHFYELGLDPQITVMPEEEARLLAGETLDEILRRHYAGRTKAAEAVQNLIEVQGEGRDQTIRALVLRLHHYTQTRPDPAAWLQSQIANFAAERPETWERWLNEALAEWRGRSLKTLERLEKENGIARDCAAALRDAAEKTEKGVKVAADLSPRTSSRPKNQRGLTSVATVQELDIAAMLEAILYTRENCPRGKKGAWVDPLADFFQEAEFFGSLLPGAEGADINPLTQDWGWVRQQMTTLLELAREFEAGFSDAKRELGVVDFHDLEQHALCLLWNYKTNEPTAIAQQWREQFRFVFVDEYQDINAAQDKIIEALSRDHPEANRFLVGDVKQSIYRFRLADPSIFQNYAAKWRDAAGQVIPLVENFRSREGILNFINALFSAIMRKEIGGVEYDEQAKLRFGAPQDRRPLSTKANPGPQVELSIRLKSNKKQHEDDSTAPESAVLGELEEADKEARSVALRLHELKAVGHPIWDEDENQFRPVEWRDMAILLRSPANKAERYAKEFAHLNIPLQVARGGFYESLEISDLLSLLAVLDNPLQDLPLLAVLHSPLVGLSVNELATVRLAAKGPFWLALVRAEGSLESGVWSPESGIQSQSDSGLRTPDSGLIAKVRSFLTRYRRWRKLARQGSLSRCLETILSESHYREWLRSQPGGEQRHANVQRLLTLAQQFDQFQRQGLFRFLRFVEAQRNADSEPDVAPVAEENAVRLMSIHQSKGLEFPVVMVADLGKPFNVSDLRADLILDDKYGLCPQIMPPDSGSRYPSLPHWLASRRQHRELLGEELRLLYVAMTRARDTLLLSATISETRFEKAWKQNGNVGEPELSSARSYADWLAIWFSRICAANSAALGGQNALLRWMIHDDIKLGAPPIELPAEAAHVPASLDPAAWEEIRKRLQWKYPFSPATQQPAKIRVSEFSRRAAERPDEEAAVVGSLKSKVWSLKSGERDQRAEGRGKREETGHRTPPGTQYGTRNIHLSRRNQTKAEHVSATDIGSIHHIFLEFVSLDRVGSVEELRADAQRLEELGVLTGDQISQLDFDGIAAFWKSKLGHEIQANAAEVRRELAFTIRFSPDDLAAVGGMPADPSMSDELIVAEGKADLALILPQEIRLVDFKTDRVTPRELPERSKLYTPQLRLYANALSKIYERPVTECWLYFLKPREAVRVNM